MERGEKIRLRFRALIQAETGAEQEHRDHRVAGGHEDVQAVANVSRVQPGRAGGLGNVVKYDDDRAEAQKILRLYEGHVLCVPRAFFAEMCPEKQKCEQGHVPDRYHCLNLSTYT